MFARVGGAESESALGAPPSIDHTVVVVEGFVHGDGQGEFGVGFEAVARGVKLLGFVFSCSGEKKLMRRLKDGADEYWEEMGRRAGLPTTRVSLGSSS